MSEGQGSPVNPPREQLTLLNEELKRRAELQSEEMEGLDRKGSTMLAGTGVVLGLVINNVDAFTTTLPGVRFLFLGALVVLTLALLAGVIVLWPRKAKVVPAPRRLVEGYYAQDHDDTLARLLSTRLAAAELNKNLTVGKVRALMWQMVLMAIGGVGLVLAFALKEWR